MLRSIQQRTLFLELKGGGDVCGIRLAIDCEFAGVPGLTRTAVPRESPSSERRVGMQEKHENFPTLSLADWWVR
jgi:hypothetical protein